MRFWKILGKLLLAIGMLFFILSQFKIRASFVFFGIAHWWYVVTAICLPLTIIPYISANRWKLFLGIITIHERILTLWRISWVSMFQGLIIPSSQGFDLLRIYYIERRHPERRGSAGSSVMVERMFGLILLCFFSLLAIPFVAKTSEFLPIILTIVGMNVIVLTVVALVTNQRLYAFYSGRRIGNSIANRVISFLEAIHGSLVAFPYRRVIFSSLCLIACFQLVVVFNVYLVFRAYGWNIPYIQHLALYPVIGILSMVPITIGGFGVREGFFVYFYSLLGVPAEVAVSASILNYMILSLIPAGFGGLFCLWDAIHGNAPRQILNTNAR